MMIRFFVLFLLVIFFGSTVALAQATDEGSNPNDPTTNEDANACFEGGTMEGKCEIEWNWTCGWYLIRFEYGIFQREQVPDGCAGLLPSVPDPMPVGPSIPAMAAGCYDSSTSDLDFYFNGAINTAQNADVRTSTDGSCTGGDAGLSHAMIAFFEGGSADALAFCQSIDPAVTSVENTLSRGYPVPNEYYWGCF